MIGDNYYFVVAFDEVGHDDVCVKEKYVCVCVSLCIKISFGFLGIILLFFYVFMSVVNLLRMEFSL